MPPPDQHYRAAVIGLGQVGSRFDEDPRRTVIWSHVGAYLHRSDQFRLVGVVEIFPPSIDAFRRRCPDVPVYPDVETLVHEVRPQIASICTPALTHGRILDQLLSCADIKLIWCEKPLSADLAEARRMVEQCAARGIGLMVSYNRHWSPFWQRVRTLVSSRAVGTVRLVRVAFPNRVLTIGSHAVDLALMLGGPIETLTTLTLPQLEEQGEPAVAALLRFASGAGGLIEVTGLKSQLMVEVEIIGDDGRVWAREDREQIVVEPFEASPRYAGYRQLGAGSMDVVTAPPTFSAFVAMADNAANWITGGMPLNCDGEHALEVQRVLEAVISNASKQQAGATSRSLGVGS